MTTLLARGHLDVYIKYVIRCVFVNFAPSRNTRYKRRTIMNSITKLVVRRKF